MKSPSETPALTELADHCLNGACNSGAIVRSLARALDENPSTSVLPLVCIKDHPAYKVVLGQLSYLAGESLGPTTEALREYDAWRHPVPKILSVGPYTVAAYPVTV